MIEISQIPAPANHKLIGFNEIKPINKSQPSLYEPVYERIFALHGVYWDKSRKERIYLCLDKLGYTCEGKIVEVNTNNLELLNSMEDIEMFWSLLSHNGYKINKCGELVPTKYWRPVYTIEEGFTPLSIDPDDSLFETFKKWDEIFDREVECAAWCNSINKFLGRNYPEIK